VNSPGSPFLPHGGYRKLRSYKVAEAVYDATVVFCSRFFANDRRMSDQAARSGVRNISEGSGAAVVAGGVVEGAGGDVDDGARRLDK